MNDHLLVTIVVIVVLLAHWIVFSWVRFKMDEGSILKHIKDTDTLDLESIAKSTRINIKRVTYVFHKSREIKNIRNTE